MKNTALTREALLEGIESMASSVESTLILRRVWKILEREHAAQTSRPEVTVPHMRRALRFYARNLPPEDIAAVLDFIHDMPRT